MTDAPRALQLLIGLGWGAPIVAGLFAFVLIRSIAAQDPGTERMQRIAALIRAGAMAFLKVEYSVLGTFAVNTNDERKIQGALFRGMLVASFVVVAFTYGVGVMLGVPFAVYLCVIVGLIAGVAIGKLTEYYTPKTSRRLRKSPGNRRRDRRRTSSPGSASA